MNSDIWVINGVFSNTPKPPSNHYDQLLLISGTSGTIQKAGNISQIAWRARGRETQIYSYGYDYLSRLTTSTYYNYSDAAVISGTNNYNENLSYDLRGNIQTLQRTGFYTNASTCTFGQIDNLTYSYTANTNRLHKVLDATVTAGDAKSRGFNGLLSTLDNSMTYDANGNLIKNLHKNVSSITYNHLNLPTVITFTTGNTIEFLYDAVGNKLSKTVKVSGVVQYVQDYLDGIEYRKTGAGVKRIESIFHAEGRYYNTNVDASNTVAWRKEYSFKDHLGNTRLVFTDRNGNGVVDITGTASTSDVFQENHYYAFGMAFEGAWLQNDASIRDNKYQYNGKELNDDFGLNWNDYGARWYDAAIGRWNRVDPLTEISRRWTPYVYSGNNPIRYNDPDGMVWANPETDGKIAKRLQDRIAERIKEEKGNLDIANKKISNIAAKIEKEGSSSKLEKQLNNAKTDAASATSAMNELNESSCELTEMGDPENIQAFTFNNIDGDVGSTFKREDGVIQMDILGEDNAIHEAKHGYILYAEGPLKKVGDLYSHEIRAYSAQFAFNASSLQGGLVPSYWGSINSLSDITIRWVIGIHNGSNGSIGDFLYAKKVLGDKYNKKFIMGLLDGERK